MNSPEPTIAGQADQRLVTIATAGHVDHGKTSLVRWLTGTDTDSLAEEKSRGLTINLGFAYAHHPDKACVLGFIDVPGHRDFIHNMLAGVSAIDAALLVVAADDGIMPQTREHLAILDLLNVQHAVVAISKTDRVAPDQLSSLQQQIRTMLSDTSLSESTVVFTSIDNNEGLETLQQALLNLSDQTAWPAANKDQQNFRFQIDRSFSIKGIGTIVTGATVAGQCQSGDSVLHSASGEKLRVRGLRFDKDELQSVTTGQRAAVNLASVGAESISRGDWLLAPEIYHPVYRIDVRLRWLKPCQVGTGTQFHLHLGAAHHLVALRALDGNDDGWYQLRSHSALHCHFRDRFIIRDPTGQETIAGGHVVDSFVPRRNRGTPQRLEELRAMDNDHETALFDLMQIRSQGISLDEFCLNRNLSSSAIQALLETCRQNGEGFLKISSEAGTDYLFATKHFESWSRQILKMLADFHQRYPSESGLSKSALNRQCEFSGPYIVFKAILTKLIDLNLLARQGSTLHLPDHTARASEDEKLFNQKIRPHLLEAGNIPPRTRELVELSNIPLKQLEKVLKHCVRRGQLIRVAENRHYLPETIEKLAGFTESLATKNDGEFSVIDFRDASGIGRNLCIEILEYFDHIGFTRREGNSRVVRTGKENLFS